jgi:hypothetical protein
MSGGVYIYGKIAGATACGAILLARCALPVLALFSAASPARAQATPSFVAANAYNAQPGAVLIQVATGVFNHSGGLLDFAVLEQVPDTGSYQVEIFHGAPNGSFCTGCGTSDLISLGPGVTGNAIAVGQFTSTGYLDIAVATNTGIDFLENDGSGNFSPPNSAHSIASTNGFVSLAVGRLHGDGNYDIAAVAPAVSGIVSFTVFIGNGARGFTPSASYPVSNTYSKCTAMMQGNFQSQTSSADLALECNNPSLASVLVYLNSGSGAFTLNQTLSAGAAFAGIVPSVALGELNSQAAIFIASQSASFVSFQSNGSTGGANAFTSVSMIPVGLGPHGAIAVLDNPLTGAVDFDVNGAGISTFTAYTQSGTSVNGNWNSTPAMGPGGVFAAGFSPNLTQGAAYVMVDASVGDGEYPNFYPFLEERSINVFLVTLNADGTVASTNAAPIYSGTGKNGYSFPPSFVTGDFTGSGLTDLAVTGADGASGDATLTIYLANPDGSLPATTSTPASVVTIGNTDYAGADAVVAGKFRNAAATGGLPLRDLAVFSSNQIFVLLSNGNGTFGPASIPSYSLSGDPNYPGFFYNPGGGAPFAPVLIAADVNGDGLDDIVLTLPEDNCNGSGSLSQGAVYVLISNGNGTFQSPVFVDPPVVNPVSAVAASFYGRAVPDLAIADGGELCSGNTAATTETEVGILQNNVTLGSSPISASDFTSATIVTQGSDLPLPDATAVATADLNGDGKPDLVVSDANGIQVWLNQGGGIFNPQGVVPLYAGDQPPSPYCIAGSTPPPTYVGCVNYVSQVATGSFFAANENDVAASVNGVAYIFQNQGLGKLSQPAQGFVAGPDSTIISAAPKGSNGLNGLLVATSQGTAYLAYLVNGTGPPIQISPATLPYGFAGESYFENFSATGGSRTGYTWSVTSGTALSAVGLGLTSAGVISGSPDAAETAAPFTVQVIDSLGNSATQNYTLTIYPGFSVTPTTLPSGAVGTLYSQMLNASGGAGGPFSFSVVSGTALSVVGLSLSSTGKISGTPSTTETAAAFTVQVADSLGDFAQLSYTLTINASVSAPAQVTDNETITVTDTETFPDVADTEKITVTDTDLVRAFNAITITPTPASFNAADGTAYQTYPYTPVQFAASGGIGVFTFTETGTLPPGITFTNGKLSGTPTASAAGNTYTFSVTATDADLDQATLQGYTLTVSTSTIPPANVTDLETITVTDTETFPGVADSETITVTDTDSVRAFNAIAISPSSASFNANSGTGIAGEIYASVPFSAMGGIGTLTLSESGALPAGINFTNGVLGGTPSLSSAGTYTFSVTAVDADGDQATQQGYTLTIAMPPPPPSYKITADPDTLSIVQGQTGETTLTFTPAGGYTGTLGLSCSGLPANSLCVFSENGAPVDSVVLTGNDQPVSVVLTFETDVNIQQAEMKITPPTSGTIWPAIAFWWSGSLLGLAALRRNRLMSAKSQRWLGLWLLLFTGAMAAGLSGCGGNGGFGTYVTPVGNSTVTVSASPASGAAQTLSIGITITH